MKRGSGEGRGRAKMTRGREDVRKGVSGVGRRMNKRDGER